MKMKFAFLSLFSYLLLTCANTLYAQCGAEWNPTGNPIGGGPGYSDSITTYDYYVTTKSELLNALSVAASGDIIYIDDNAEIDMTGQSFLWIPERVTLCSGRGRTLGDRISWGGLIYCTEHERSAELIRTGGKKVRISGLRLRGGFSPLEGQQLESDSFPQPLPVSYYGIEINRDSVEVDNCEIWGFSGAPIAGNNCQEVNIHHNYFHDGHHCYHAYGVAMADSTEYYYTANFADYYQWLLMSGGGYCMPTRGYHSWSIFGHHTFGTSFECHTAYGYDSCAFDSIYNCSFYTTGYTYDWKSGYKLPHPARDPTVVRDSWFKNDSSKSVGIGSGAAAKFINNWYSPNPPPGVEGRIPVASINCDVDSGTAPLTVQFNAASSYDPDGQVIAYYWIFGDSLQLDNYARYTDNRTVSYTYNQIGKYLVELMVVDNHGIMNYAYKTINVTPNNNRYWLSCWIKDRNYDKIKGYFKKQILLNNWVCWEKDIAGNGSWEHVILDVTDSLSGKDSVILAFRLFCTRDTSKYFEPTVYVDDVVLYGADVVNGDFESGTWTGNVYTRTDGHWQGSSYGTAYLQAIDFEMDVHSGKRSFYLGTTYENNNHQGNWGKVEQKVAVSALGLATQNGEKPTFSLSYPFPNPSMQNLAISYQLPNRGMISLKIYDINGRFVRTLVDGEKEPGNYRVIWDRRDEKNRAVVNGVYFCRFSTNDYDATRKLVLLR